MDNKIKQQAQWMSWGLFGADYVMSLGIMALLLALLRARHKPWDVPFLGYMVFFSVIIGAQHLARHAWRRRGLSRETRFEMTWLNAWREEDGPRVASTVAYPWWLHWSLLSFCVGPLPVSGALYFCLPADKQADLEVLQLSSLVAAALFAVAFTSSPMALRVDAWGVHGMIGARADWSRIASCRVEIGRDVVGAVSSITAHFEDAGGRKLARIWLPHLDKKLQAAFLLALHRALQPHEDAPDFRQILADDTNDART
jgi:hypothetical protein